MNTGAAENLYIHIFFSVVNCTKILPQIFSPLGAKNRINTAVIIYLYNIADGTVVDQATIRVTSSTTLGRMCMPFTAGVNSGVIENDQNFTVELQDLETTPAVTFPNEQSANVEVLEGES